MQKDIRDTPLYQEIQGLYQDFRRPGSGLISDAASIHAAPDGRQAVFVGTMLEKLEGMPATRICQVDLTTGHTQVLTFGPNTDRLPKYSPAGDAIAFLSDRNKAGDFQLYFLDTKTGAAVPAPVVEGGWVEYLHWSPDGKQILLGVAGHGADVAASAGAVTSEKAGEALPPWMPALETGDENYRWRSAWVYGLESDSLRQVSSADCNIWEAVWCGNDALAAVMSSAPGEEYWYTATLNLIDINSCEARLIYQPKDQLAWPSATPAGDALVLVEAVCSDRGVVAGKLLLIDPHSAEVQTIDTKGVEVSYAQWRSDDQLLLAGIRSFETVVGEFSKAKAEFAETWRSEEISCGMPYPVVTPLGDGLGDCLLIGEGFLRAPEIAFLRDGAYSPLVSFDQGYAAQMTDWIASVQPLRWSAPDGKEIQGWLILPQGEGPHPLVTFVHGGPVFQSRPAWLGRGLTGVTLLKHGYALFLPNPRGSTGQGSDFTRLVYGDMGGAETDDHLSGLDYLIEQGIADPKRLGVSGASHGGFMASWIITQDARFAAAVPVAPVTDWASLYLTSNLPHFCTLILKGNFNEADKDYFHRSPVMHAHKVKTPTLNICGALDCCTPPGQAMEFHHALLENGVKSVLVTYLQEGHGVRQLPATIDYAARVVGWFEEHMPAG